MMKTFATMISVVFGTAAFAYELETKLSPDPAKTGKQTLEIVVKNDKGTPETKAPITAKAMMPATKEMMEMVSNGKIETVAPGKYSARFNISMEGVWFIHVNVGEGKDLQKFVYEIATGKPGMKKVAP